MNKVDEIYNIFWNFARHCISCGNAPQECSGLRNCQYYQQATKQLNQHYFEVVCECFPKIDNALGFGKYSIATIEVTKENLKQALNIKEVADE